MTGEVVRDFRLTGDVHYNNYAFDQALQAYQRALRYVAKQQTPQLWAAIMLDIGKAHTELGNRTTGLDIHTHLTAAVQAYNQDLEVYTRETLPPQCAQTHYNLAEAYIALKDWSNAAASYTNVLQVYPDAEKAYRTASGIYT